MATTDLEARGARPYPAPLYYLTDATTTNGVWQPSWTLVEHHVLRCAICGHVGRTRRDYRCVLRSTHVISFRRWRAGPRGEQVANLLRDPLTFLRDMRGRHGGVVTFVLGGERVVLVSDPLAAQAIVVDDAAIWVKVGTAFFPGSSLAGNGLLVSDGDTWQRQRRLANPAFRRTAVRQRLGCPRTQAHLNSINEQFVAMTSLAAMLCCEFDQCRASLQDRCKLHAEFSARRAGSHVRRGDGHLGAANARQRVGAQRRTSERRLRRLQPADV
jgi:uncharacterized C2H2 Zn-finger protein